MRDSENSEVPARSEIKIGQRVWAIEKRNYGTEDLTEGVVKRILTGAPVHSRGIKVVFEAGIGKGGDSHFLGSGDHVIQTDQRERLDGRNVQRVAERISQRINPVAGVSDVSRLVLRFAARQV